MWRWGLFGRVAIMQHHRTYYCRNATVGRKNSGLSPVVIESETQIVQSLG